MVNNEDQHLKSPNFYKLIPTKVLKIHRPVTIGHTDPWDGTNKCQQKKRSEEDGDGLVTPKKMARISQDR